MDKLEDAGNTDTEDNDDLLCIKAIHVNYDGSDFWSGPLSQ